jgi:heme exporter protein D
VGVKEMDNVMAMGKRERIIWISVSIVILAIAILVISNYQTRLTTVNQRVADLEGSKTAWTQREAKLTTEIADLKAQVEKDTELIKTFPTNNPEIINSLKRQGFNGGVQEIIGDLLKHNELIPFEGVLGGKMGFYRKEQVFVISDKWVIAYFDDGHIEGNMLLSYSVKNGNISWKVIDSYLLNQ